MTQGKQEEPSEDPYKIEPLPADFRLFGPGKDWRSNASLHIKEKDWYVYGEGYKLAADRLVRHVLESEHDLDFLVYPVAFLYRHYVELRLKEILKNGGYLAEMNTDVRINHDLLFHWEQAKKLLRKVWPTDSKESRYVMSGADRVIKQLAAVDPTSYAFRYPVDRKDNANLSGLRAINLRQLAQGIQYAARLLDGSVIGIEEESHIKAEMEWEAHQEELRNSDPGDYYEEHHEEEHHEEEQHEEGRED